MASKQLGPSDERDLFPTALSLIEQTNPKAVMLENVRGLASAKFSSYRLQIITHLNRLGYEADWRLIFSSQFGVPQLRPRFILVAIKRNQGSRFTFPEPNTETTTVGDVLFDLMAEDGWEGAIKWREKANTIAPTIVGGSKKHGGADLGPSRAKREWLALGIDGKGIGNNPPPSDAGEDILPRLTLRMVARLQGFPDDWEFCGGKTSSYRQIGNAFPPPVAEKIGLQIAEALCGDSIVQKTNQLEINFAA